MSLSSFAADVLANSEEFQSSRSLTADHSKGLNPQKRFSREAKQELVQTDRF